MIYRLWVIILAPTLDIFLLFHLPLPPINSPSHISPYPKQQLFGAGCVCVCVCLAEAMPDSKPKPQQVSMLKERGLNSLAISI